jgi:ABC-2 type transport system ATP-binding protein
VIEVCRVSKRYGAVLAVRELSFAVPPGVVTGFLGPNGAGKTTTLRVLLGLLRPTSGTATIGGLQYRDIPAPITVVGAALESSSFHPARSARNHLRVLCTAAGLPICRADQTLRTVGLAAAADRKVRTYSLGMRQRLSLAAALLGDPQVLVLDEPANGLDPDGIRWLRSLLRTLAQEGRTVLVSSHQLSEIEEIADRVVILNRGRLVISGSIAELTAGTERVLVRSPDADALRTVIPPPATVEQTGRDTLQIRGANTAEIGHHAFAAGVELHELRGDRIALEELFFTLTAGAA